MIRSKRMSLIIILAVLGLGFPGSLRAQSDGLEGSWTFISDSGGATAQTQGAASLTFSAGRVSFAAGSITDEGPYSVQGNKITLTFGRLGKSVAGQPFSKIGNMMVLPFQVYSEAPGTSTWQRQTGENQPGSGQGTQGGKGDKGDQGTTGKGTKGNKGDAGKNGRPGKDGKNAEPKEPAASWAGDYQGAGSGQEVRYRHPNGLLILTVKHDVEFYFHVDDKGNVEGEGTVTYDLERNTKGLDELVEAVSKAVEMMPIPKADEEVVGKAAGSVIDDLNKHELNKTKGVTSLQYDAPHLKFGKEIRHIEFKGRIEKTTLMNGGGQETRLYLEQTGDYLDPDDKPDPSLIAEWEVNGVKEEKKFPCWSPFLKNAGLMRQGPGDLWIVEFQEEGEHRNGVKPWQEFGYVWKARQFRVN